MQSKFIGLALLAGLTLSGTAFAESTADSLTRIEAETLLLKAREKQLDVQAKILAKQQEIAARQTENDPQVRTAAAGAPVIQSVEGIGRSLYATLQLANGSFVDVQVGDVLPNGMKVVSIRPNEVIAATGNKQRVRLSTASAAPEFLTPLNSNPVAALPMLPPPPLPYRGSPR
jgi:type IV pilus biogenesis protein PilP